MKRTDESVWTGSGLIADDHRPKYDGRKCDDSVINLAFNSNGRDSCKNGF